MHLGMSALGQGVGRAWPGIANSAALGPLGPAGADDDQPWTACVRAQAPGTRSRTTTRTRRMSTRTTWTCAPCSLLGHPPSSPSSTRGPASGRHPNSPRGAQVARRTRSHTSIRAAHSAPAWTSSASLTERKRLSRTTRRAGPTCRRSCPSPGRTPPAAPLRWRLRHLRKGPLLLPTRSHTWRPPARQGSPRPRAPRRRSHTWRLCTTGTTRRSQRRRRPPGHAQRRLRTAC